MFVGVGASASLNLFEQAKKNAGPAIVSSTKIDACGRQRGRWSRVVVTTRREQTLNQTPSEMDGFEGNNGTSSSRLQTVPMCSTRPVAAQAVSTAQWWSQARLQRAAANS